MKPTGPIFDREWRLSCFVEPVFRHEVDKFIKSHYLGKWPGVCTLVLGLKRERKLLGTIVFALPPRETAVRYGGLTWELARLWISDDVPKNAESYLISQAVRYIRKNCSNVHALVSYADPSVGHSGIIYRAANWISDGKTDEGRKTPRFDYADARTGVRYSRRSHVPIDAVITKIPRVSKARFYLKLKKAP